MGEPLNILFVEDHVDTLEALSKLLTHRGHSVVSACDYQTAIEKGQAQRFDVLIADIGLPDGDGTQLLQELRKLYPIRGIILSGFAMKEDVEKSEAAGYSQFLSKPCTSQAIYDAVERVVQSAEGT